MRSLWHRWTTALVSGWLPFVAEAAETAPTAGKAAPALEPLATGGLLQMLLGLLVVLALIAGLAWMMRRSGALQGGAAGSLRILGGLSMGARERIVLVQVGDKQLLLGVAPGRVQTLHVLEEPVALREPGRPVAGSFAANLSAALRRGRSS